MNQKLNNTKTTYGDQTNDYLIDFILYADNKITLKSQKEIVQIISSICLLYSNEYKHHYYNFKNKLQGQYMKITSKCFDQQKLTEYLLSLKNLKQQPNQFQQYMNNFEGNMINILQYLCEEQNNLILFSYVWIIQKMYFIFDPDHIKQGLWYIDFTQCYCSQYELVPDYIVERFEKSDWTKNKLKYLINNQNHLGGENKQLHGINQKSMVIQQQQEDIDEVQNDQNKQNLLDQINNLTLQNEQLNRKVQDLESSLQQKIYTLQQIHKQFKIKILEMDEKINMSLHQCNDLKDEYQNMKTKYDDIAIENKQLKQQNCDLKSQIYFQQQYITKQDLHFVKLKTQNNGILLQYQQNLIKIEELQRGQEQSNIAIQQMDEQMKSYRIKIEQQNQCIESINHSFKLALVNYDEQNKIKCNKLTLQFKNDLEDINTLNQQLIQENQLIYSQYMEGERELIQLNEMNNQNIQEISRLKIIINSQQSLVCQDVIYRQFKQEYDNNLNVIEAKYKIYVKFVNEDILLAHEIKQSLQSEQRQVQELKQQIKNMNNSEENENIDIKQMKDSINQDKIIIEKLQMRIKQLEEKNQQLTQVVQQNQEKYQILNLMNEISQYRQEQMLYLDNYCKFRLLYVELQEQLLKNKGD